MPGEIDQANQLLRDKGYAPERLLVQTGFGPSGAVLKGSKIVSPLSDQAETVLRIVRDLIPPAADLGPRQLVPRDLREQLEHA